MSIQKNLLTCLLGVVVITTVTTLTPLGDFLSTKNLQQENVVYEELSFLEKGLYKYQEVRKYLRWYEPLEDDSEGEPPVIPVVNHGTDNGNVYNVTTEDTVSNVTNVDNDNVTVTVENNGEEQGENNGEVDEPVKVENSFFKKLREMLDLYKSFFIMFGFEEDVARKIAIGSICIGHIFYFWMVKVIVCHIFCGKKKTKKEEKKKQTTHVAKKEATKADAEKAKKAAEEEAKKKAAEEEAKKKRLEEEEAEKKTKEETVKTEEVPTVKTEEVPTVKTEEVPTVKTEESKQVTDPPKEEKTEEVPTEKTDGTK